MSSKQTYRPRQPLLQRFSEAWLHADVVAAVRGGSDADLNEVVTEVHPRLFELRLFSSELLEALLRELHVFEHWCEHHDVKPLRPNSMNNYGFMMSQLGLDFALDEFLDEWLVPITSRLFHEHAGDALDHHHSFVVDYAESGDTALGFHVDDSEVTVNACLGFAFEGAEVYFEGE